MGFFLPAIQVLLLLLAVSNAEALLPAGKISMAQPAGWTRFAFPGTQVRKLWTSPQNPARLFGGNSLTLDGGGTWSRYPFERVVSMGFAPNGVFYATAAFPSGFYRSPDGGATWTLIPEAESARAWPTDDMVVDPRDPAVIYGAALTSGIGAIKSTDGGRTWRVANEGLSPGGDVDSGVRNIAIDPRAPDILYATNEVTRGVYKTTNGADQWFQVTASPIDASDLAIDPGNPSVVFVTGPLGTWRSRDGGATWAQIAAGARVIAFNPLNSNEIYVGGSSTPVRRSLDGGDNWEDFSAGLDPLRAVYTLAFRLSNPPELWAGTNDGLYRYVFPELDLRYRLYFPTIAKGFGEP